MRCAILMLVPLCLAFAPAPFPRREVPEADWQKAADAAPWLAPEAGTKTAIEVRGVLYRAEFHPHTNGCALVAFDLKARRQLWRPDLKGVGLVDHSKYFNAVRVEPLNGEVLVVYGQESAGRYIEIVSLRTGRTLGHRRLREQRP